MGNRIITAVALFSVMVALTGLASAFDIEFLTINGTKENPVLLRNGENITLAVQLSNLRSQDFNITSSITGAFIACSNGTGALFVNCDFSDFNFTLLKTDITATGIPITLQNDTVFLAMMAPPQREPGTQYSFAVNTGPFGDPPETAQVSLTLILEGGNITGMKFNDLNGNGIMDAGEPGLPGWKIILKNSSTGAEIANTTTDANGNYNFSNVRGNLTVVEVLQPGWIQTAPANKFYNVTIDAQDVNGLNFGNFQPGSISGMKFNDLNDNGVKDVNEPGLGGWMINLTGFDTITKTQVNLSTLTAGDGTFSFTGLTNGTYTLSEVQQNGWVNTLAPAPVNIRSGTVSTGNNFGNWLMPTPTSPIPTTPLPPGVPVPATSTTGAVILIGLLTVTAVLLMRKKD